MPARTETPTPMPTDRAGKQVTEVFTVFEGWWHSTGLTGVIPQTKAAWDEDVTIVFSDYTSREERALAGHLTMIQSLGEWEKFPVGHSHPQLLSEPDD